MKWLDGITDSRLNGYEFEEIQGDSDGQGSWAACSLLFCSSWAHVYGVFIVIHTFMHINLFELYLIDVCVIS